MSQQAPHINRYPGSSPFTREFKDLFFGREKDLEDLYKQLFVHKLTVLYGKSGLGKSSLLNAGLIPKMEDETNQFVSVVVRFGGYRQGSTLTPENIFLQRIRELSGEGVFMGTIEPAPASMWQVFKQFEWKNKDKKGIFLVLDQFEEVFTYPETVEQFALRFSELLNNRMPDDFRQKLYARIRQEPDFLKANEEAVNFTEQSPNLKILIGIRSDKLSLLDRFSAYVPNILKNCYELLPLGREQARDAIVRPAAEEKHGPYLTHPFRYSEAALDNILDFLTHGGERTVEPFLLQIICQHVESMAPRTDAAPAPEPPFTAEPSMLGNLDAVTRLYYVNALRASDDEGKPIFSEFERLNIRYLIERNLIEPRSRVRVTLDKNLVEKKGISAELIEKIVNSRLVRREPNAVSGLSYELSHDTLVDPILRAHELLGNLDDKALEYYKQAFMQLLGEHDLETLHEFVENKLIDRQGQSRTVVRDKLTAPDSSVAEVLFRVGLLRYEPHADGSVCYGLYHLFIFPALTLRNEREEKARREQEIQLADARAASAEDKRKRKRAVIFAVVSGTLSLIAILSGIATFVSMQRAHEAEEQAILNESRALENLYLANVNWDKAETARKTADSLRQIAYSDATDARKQRQLADINAEAAKRQSQELQIAQRELQIALREARSQADTAGVNYELARKSEQFALAEKKRSDSLTLRLRAEGDSLKAARFRLEQLAQVKDVRANTARSYELTALAFQQLPRDPALALRLAEAALQKADTELARRALLNSWYSGQGTPLDSLPAQYARQPRTPYGPYGIQISGSVVRLLDRNNQPLQSFTNPQNPKQSPRAVTFTLDGKYLAAEYPNGKTLFWSLDPGDIIRRANTAGMSRLTAAECVRFNVECR